MLKRTVGVLVLLLVGCNPPQQSREEPEESTKKTQLELLWWEVGREADYAVVEGMVRNISDDPIKALLAVATWKDAGGSTLVSDIAFIEPNPLGPGQEGLFRVLTVHDPSMDEASIDFNIAGGGGPVLWTNADQR